MQKLAVVFGFLLGHLFQLPCMICSSHAAATEFPNIDNIHAAKRGELPYQLQLRYMDGHLCAATLVESPAKTQIAITAASCIGYDLSKLTLVGGTTSLLSLHGTDEDGTQKIQVKEAVLHKEYDPKKNLHNIAVVVLKENFEINANVTPVRLGNLSDEGNYNNLTISGWEFDSEEVSIQSIRLYAIDIQKVNNNYCETCPGTISKSQFCGGVETDSGGPVVATFKNDKFLAGVSFRGGGTSCPVYGVYNRVASYYDWIKQVAEDYK